MRVRKYDRPPIVEALCEFQFSPDSEWDKAAPDRVYKALRGQFPVKKQAQRVAVEVAMSPSEQRIGQQSQSVLQFLTKNEKSVVQVAPHMLTINQLAPYISWLKFFPLIRKCFKVYEKTVAPSGLHQIGLRYINRL